MSELKPGEKILEYLRREPHNRFSSRQISSDLDMERSTVRRNLLRLVDADLINMKLGHDSRTGRECFVYSYDGDVGGNAT